MKRYSDYKDSGVEWLGEIPEHWEVKRLKLMARIKNGQDYKLVYTDEPIYPVIGSGGQFAYASQYLFKGESVLLGRKGTVDKPLYINCAFWTVDTMFYSEINNNTFPKFLYYSALTIPFKYLLTNTTVPSMTQYDLGNHLFAFAPIDEQKTIARFLDRKLEQIGHFISNKQRLIELLKEQKTAIVNRAVTKGLNPHASMKPSGVEWLEDIPAHWEIVPMKKLCSVIKDGLHQTPSKVDEGVTFISTQHVRNRTIDISNATCISYEDYQAGHPKVAPAIGDVLITLVGSIGFAAIVQEQYLPLSCTRHVGYVRPTEKIMPEYLLNYIESAIFKAWIDNNISQIAQPSIYLRVLATHAISTPPLSEQKEIVAYLDKESAKVDIAIAKTEKEIELIQEYRTTLISDAVTGKIDVRELTHSS